MTDFGPADRSEAWDVAKRLVDPVVEQHGLEESKIGGALFLSPKTLTKVDQHLNHIMNVADWLLKGDN